MRIVIAGATGLVGGLLFPKLVGHDLTIVTRRDVPGVPAGSTQLTGSMEDWPALMAGGAWDVAISCLGTTIRVAGSQPAFAEVDRDAVAAFAVAGRGAGVRQFLMVSSVGANAKAVNFYLKTKGEAEDAVVGLGFTRVDIFRPGLLRGDRSGSSRAGEGIAMRISPFTDLLTPRAFDKYRSIAAVDVASAIAACVGEAAHGLFVHHNRDMLREAARIG
jgi:uncharacterized protein YbjT (DUF2867 family)